MIASPPPPPSVFIRAQAMASADVAAECLAPIAAIKAHYIIPMYGTAHRHRRGPNLLRLTRLSKLTDRPMNGGNQIGKLIRPQHLVPDVAHTIFTVRCGLISSVFTKQPLLIWLEPSYTRIEDGLKGAGGLDRLGPGDQHQPRRARQVEFWQQHVDSPEAVGGHDEQSALSPAKGRTPHSLRRRSQTAQPKVGRPRFRRCRSRVPPGWGRA